jgi:hypothetical protein
MAIRTFRQPPAGLQSSIAEAHILSEKGVCAIAGNCGLMIVY